MIANTVLITDRYHPSAIHRLKLKMAYEVKEHHSYELKPKDLVGVCALLIRSRTKIHSDLLIAANQLKVIVTATSGFDHIDLNACIRAGIHVMNTPMANAMSAAELTLCQMLNLTKSSISLHNGIIKNQSWKHHYSFFGDV